MEKKRQVSIYLENDMIEKLDEMSKDNGLYLSQVIEQLVKLSIDNRDEVNAFDFLNHQGMAKKYDRNHVEVRLLEMGVEACLLTRKVLEKQYCDPKEFERIKASIKQEAIQFTANLSKALR